MHLLLTGHSCPTGLSVPGDGVSSTVYRRRVDVRQLAENLRRRRHAARQVTRTVITPDKPLTDRRFRPQSAIAYTHGSKKR